LINKKKKILIRSKGSTLVEALISTAILSFVIVSILGAVSQQQMTTRNTSDKNIAVFLAESRLEELLKLPANQLQPETFVDYAVQKTNPSGSSYNYNLDFISEDEDPPDELRQFRRTTNIIIDDLGEMADITVTVDYGRTKDIYPFSVVLTARRTTE